MKSPVLCAVLLLLLCPAASRGSEPDPLAALLEEQIPRLMDTAGIPGLSIAVVRDGQISWSGAFGVRSRDTKQPVDEQTMFEAASLSKTVTAVAALKLVEQGKLSLDRSLADYLPYPRLADDERYRKLTARLVLTHTTGLPNWGNEFLRDPGKLFGYSGEGFEYLGRTIAAITGMSLDEFARQEIFEPLGMSRTSYVWTPAYAENGAVGHDRHGVADELRKRTEANGAASLLTTASDYARFLCAVMDDRVLEPETTRLMLSPLVKATKWRQEELHGHISWGLGWGIQPGGKENAFWHWGDNGDLRGYTVAYKEARFGLVFLANSESLFTIAAPLIELVLDDEQYAFDWLDHDRYDDPKWLGKMKAEKAFLRGQTEAGLAELERLRREHSDVFSFEDAGAVAAYLGGRDKVAEAQAILQWVVASDPEGIDGWVAFGRFHLERGQHREALKHLNKVIELDPDNALAKSAISWAKQVVEAEASPVAVPEKALAAYAGDYGPRHITLRQGKLYYQRDGRDEYRLLPLSQDTFALEQLGRFRLRFVLDDGRNVTKVVGLYLGGDTDESPRDLPAK